MLGWEADLLPENKEAEQELSIHRVCTTSFRLWVIWSWEPELARSLNPTRVDVISEGAPQTIKKSAFVFHWRPRTVVGKSSTELGFKTWLHCLLTLVSILYYLHSFGLISSLSLTFIRCLTGSSRVK